MPLADGHADSLMWNRDLTTRQRRGQVDFPRLKEADVRIQCFTVVTRGYPVVDGIGRPLGVLSARDALVGDARQFEHELIQREEITVIL